MNRGHRKEDVEKAYQIQSRAGAIGFAQYGAVGLGLASIGHHFWPSFRYEQPTQAANRSYSPRTDDRRYPSKPFLSR